MKTMWLPNTTRGVAEHYQRQIQQLQSDIKQLTGELKWMVKRCEEAEATRDALLAERQKEATR